MSHPRNKRERFLIGERKGKKRTDGYWRGTLLRGDPEKFMRKNAQLRRNTTKLCSCEMCRNPRHSEWNRKKDKLTMAERKFLDRCNDEDAQMAQET